LLGSLSSSRAQLDLLEQFTSTSSSVTGMQVHFFSLNQINGFANHVVQSDYVAAISLRIQVI